MVITVQRQISNRNTRKIKTEKPIKPLLFNHTLARVSTVLRLTHPGNHGNIRVFLFFWVYGNAAGAAAEPLGGVSAAWTVAWDSDATRSEKTGRKMSRIGRNVAEKETGGCVLGLVRGSAPFLPALASELS